LRINRRQSLRPPGQGHAASAHLDLVKIGNLEVRDVAALVLPDEALSENLLGLSFLSRLRRLLASSENQTIA
jgi:clan AA aspartic protease (TIGR02281 family)